MVTNPPFSLFREYLTQLVSTTSSSWSSATCTRPRTQELFPLISGKKVWWAINSGHMWFRVPDGYEPLATDTRRTLRDRSGGASGTWCWFTNLDFTKRHEDLILYKTYNAGGVPDVRQLRRHRGRRACSTSRGLRRGDGGADHLPGASTTPTSSRSSGSRRRGLGRQPELRQIAK